ncbi:MAG: TetR/AcrR family transcriptional regulator [Labilithrix sp.]|nr:TetR/AcrR family transcriptional regulator [Labilithrix sp.]
MQGRPLTAKEAARMRARLTAVALRLVEREGRDACSLRRVGAEAGVSRTTPYTYFPDKEALLDSVRVSALDALSAKSEKAMSAAPSLEAKLAAVGRAYVEFALRRPALYDLIFDPRTGGPEHDAAVRRYRGLAELPLVEARAAGLTVLAPERLGQVLWAATHGALHLHRAGKLRHGVDLERLLKDLGDVLAFGFVPRDFVPRDTEKR